MKKQLTAHTATLKTASVEIKALTIEGKQVTMAVFRQLSRANLINRDTGEMMGQPCSTSSAT